MVNNYQPRAKLGDNTLALLSQYASSGIWLAGQDLGHWQARPEQVRFNLCVLMLMVM